MSFQPPHIRQDFPTLASESGERRVYLDNAATTQTPVQVIERIAGFYREENANVGRGLYDLANTATQAYSDARSTVADFLSASRGEIVFTRNTTEAMNLLASSLEIDGKLVLPEMSHHSNQLPWRRKAEVEGLELEYVPSEGHTLDLQAASEMIDSGTSLVSLSHISNVFGSENPVREIVDIAHENDAYVVVDGAQSVPRIPTDVKELGVDFLAFSGHKMLGPTGIGGLYGKKPLLEGMEPYQVGGGMIRRVTKEETRWEEVPERFEAGTPNIAGAVGLGEAISYLEAVGLEDIRDHEIELNRRMRQELSSIEGVEVLAPDKSFITSFTMEGIHSHDIAEVLNQEGVAIRAGHHCAQPLMESLGLSGTARASTYLYNDRKDLERLVKAVERVNEVFN